MNTLRSWWSCLRGRHLQPLVPNRDSVMQWDECLRCGQTFNVREIIPHRDVLNPQSKDWWAS